MESILNFLVDLDTSPNWNALYSGKCIIENSEITVLLNINEDNLDYDGFTILKTKDIGAYRIWDKEEISSIKNDNSKEQLKNLNLKDFKNITTALKHLKSELVAIYDNKDADTYYVGKVISVTPKILTLKLIDEDAKWIEEIDLKINEINYVGFGTLYEKQLLKKPQIISQEPIKNNP